MKELIEKEKILSKIRDILIKYGNSIKFAYLFGSFAKDQSDEYSDIDLGIFFAENISDEVKNSVRFEIMDALEPYKVDICYLDKDDIGSEIFLEATDGIPIIINDEDSLYEARIKHIHLYEELKLVNITR
ncbi:nucleotidyltransferase domain-containing protein [Thermodesulfovibrio sp. TK110]